MGADEMAGEMIRKLDIAVPDLNDSFSRVVLDGVQFLIRFTWNNMAQRWSFGLYTMQKEPLAVGLRIVPKFPLTLQIVDKRFPTGSFVANTILDHIGRKDFLEGRAIFLYFSLVN
jgi:hypothetical protein